MRVVNVGAGAGSYEPADGFVVAVDPVRDDAAPTPAAMRHPRCSPRAEALPFADDTFDAALASLTRAPLGRPRARLARDAARRAPTGDLLLRALAGVISSGSSASTSPRSSISRRSAPRPGSIVSPRRSRSDGRRAGSGACRLSGRVRGLLLEPARGVSRPRRASGYLVVRATRSGSAARGAPSNSGATSRAGSGTNATAICAIAPRSTSGTGCWSPASPYPERRAPPGFAEGLARTGDPPTLRGRRPRAHACVRRRLPGDHRRSARRRRHDPSPAGDSPVRRRRSVRRRCHRTRLDRGDERRGRDPHRAALLEGNGATDPDGARGRRRLAVAIGCRSPARRAGAHRVSGADAAVPREARRRCTCHPLVRRDRGEDPARSPTPWSRSPRRAGRCAPQDCACSTRSSFRTPS